MLTICEKWVCATKRLCQEYIFQLTTGVSVWTSLYTSRYGLYKSSLGTYSIHSCHIETIVYTWDFSMPVPDTSTNFIVKHILPSSTCQAEGLISTIENSSKTKGNQTKSHRTRIKPVITNSLYIWVRNSWAYVTHVAHQYRKNVPGVWFLLGSLFGFNAVFFGLLVLISPSCQALPKFSSFSERLFYVHIQLRPTVEN